MDAAALAEAGLSECGRTDADCMPGFGTFLLAIGLIALAVIIWITITVNAAFAVAESDLRPHQRLLWALAVLAIPLVGASAWFIARSRSADSVATLNAKGD